MTRLEYRRNSKLKVYKHSIYWDGEKMLGLTDEEFNDIALHAPVVGNLLDIIQDLVSTLALVVEFNSSAKERETWELTERAEAAVEALAEKLGQDSAEIY